MSETAPDALRYEVAERVATITLNRPEASNPLGPDVAQRIVGFLHAADTDAGVKSILIRAEGSNFCAGGDVKNFSTTLDASPQERAETFDARLASGNRLPQALVGSRKPIVAAARGAVVGAGMALCLGADFAVCGTSSFFIAAHVRVGLSVDCGLSGLLVATLGLRQAKRLALLGQKVDAQEALALGLATEVVPDAEVDARARRLALQLADGPAMAMAGTRSLLNEAAHRHLLDQLGHEAAWLARCAATDDFPTGVRNAIHRERRPFA